MWLHCFEQEGFTNVLCFCSLSFPDSADEAEQAPHSRRDGVVKEQGPTFRLLVLFRVIFPLFGFIPDPVCPVG